MCRDFTGAPLEGNILQVDFSNWQDIFIITKSFWLHFEKHDGRHWYFFDGHQGALDILRLFLIDQKLILFIIDIFNGYNTTTNSYINILLR